MVIIVQAFIEKWRGCNWKCWKTGYGEIDDNIYHHIMGRNKNQKAYEEWATSVEHVGFVHVSKSSFRSVYFESVIQSLLDDIIFQLQKKIRAFNLMIKYGHPYIYLFIYNIIKRKRKIIINWFIRLNCNQMIKRVKYKLNSFTTITF